MPKGPSTRRDDPKQTNKPLKAKETKVTEPIEKPDESSDRQGLSTVAKAGITAAVVAVIALAVWLLIPKGSKVNSEIIASAIQNAVGGDSTTQVTIPQVTNQYFESGLGVCSYTGPVDNEGKPHGIGSASFSDGRSYQGPFVHGVAEGGNATFTFANGDTFRGAFQADKFKEGRCTFADDGSYFEGTFRNGQPDTGHWYNRQGQRQD